MSLSFIARGGGMDGLAAPSARLLIMGNSSCIIGRPSVIRVCWALYEFHLLMTSVAEYNLNSLWTKTGTLLVGMPSQWLS
jgi:hypothetical protein